jgi:hypothetical protein
MPVTSPASSPEHASLTPEAQAGALWTFVQSKAPRFTFDHALQVIKQLSPRPGEDPKTLAKRLRKALQAHGIAFKHTHSLHAVSRLCGYSSWHTNDDADLPRLRFTTFGDLAGLSAARSSTQDFPSWSGLATAMVEFVDILAGTGQMRLGVLAMKFGDTSLMLSTPVPARQDAEQQRPQSWPVALIAPQADTAGWLEGAAPALERLRRHLEERGMAVLDGYAALQLCAESHDVEGAPLSVRVGDVVNSELVLLREDNEDDPLSSYEVARGDEVTCWHQLELAMQDDRTGAMPLLDITVPGEGVGAWFVNGRRFVWALETLHPREHVPGRTTRFIGPTECQRLLRRYKLAKRIHGGGFKYHEQTKGLAYLSGTPEEYRVDQHFLLRILSTAGLTWDAYLRNFDAEPMEMTSRLPVGFVFQLLQNLKVDDPNKVFAQPNISEMHRVTDDGLLRALMPRVETVRYVRPRELSKDESEQLHEALDQFGSGLRMQKIVAGGGFPMEKELPYLVYASDAQELFGAVRELGLTMYAAVMPHLLSTKGLLPETPGLPPMWPWALGNAIFLRFERKLA